MKHRKARRTLGRSSSHRLSMLKNMALSLFKHRKIKTTHIRALELSKFTDRIVTLAKNDDLQSKRRIFADLNDKNIARQVFDMAKAQYADRKGGYTRIIKEGFRKGDNSLLVRIELV